MKIIESVDHLKKLSKRKNIKVRILLAGGLGYTTRTIRYIDNKFRITNHFDNSKEFLSEAELYTLSNIGEAINKNCLIMEE